jgi:hypothetical protein
MKARTAGDRANSRGTHPSKAASVAILAPPPLDNAPKTTDEEEASAFEEIPTVANRERPAAESPAQGADLPQILRTSAGSYRLIRPTSADVVNAPEAGPAAPKVAKRVVIGRAAKPG